MAGPEEVVDDGEGADGYDDDFDQDEPLAADVDHDIRPQGGGGKHNTTDSTMATAEDVDQEINIAGPPSDWQYPRIKLQPANQHQWQQNTTDSLNHAKALMRDAHFQMSKNDRAKSDSERRHVANTANVSKNLRNKVDATKDLVHCLEERIESVEDTIRQTGECLFQLHRAHRSKWAPLNVCERRLELREGRPLQELIRDSLQEALENERQSLIEARQELADQIQGTKEMLASLEKIKQELLQDLQQKRHIQKLDRSCMLPDKAVGKEAERVFLPALPEVGNYSLPPSPKETPRGTGRSFRQIDTRALLTRALRFEENAMRLCNENDAAMLHSKRETGRANAATCVCMSKSNEGTYKLKRQLEQHIKEIDATIKEVNSSLHKTKKRLDSHEAPLRALNKQFALRDHRTDPEAMRDQVTDELESQLESVKKSVAVLTAKWQSTKNILDQLRQSRQHMLDDFKCKMISVKIDDACRKVTPKKAIELDRLDPRGGRCHPDAKKSPGARVQAILDNELGSL